MLIEDLQAERDYLNEKIFMEKYFTEGPVATF
jgi:hypothetical protein